MTGFIRPVGPLLSLQVRGSYLQLNTGSGTDGGVVGGEDFGLESLDTFRDSACRKWWSLVGWCSWAVVLRCDQW